MFGKVKVNGIEFNACCTRPGYAGGYIIFCFFQVLVCKNCGDIILWLLILTVVTALTGIYSWLFAPTAHARHDFIEIHDKTGIILAILFIFHFINHWKWFTHTYSDIRRWLSLIPLPPLSRLKLPSLAALNIRPVFAATTTVARCRHRLKMCIFHYRP